ncbi:Uncharacterised protein [Gardnerella vaginalis]|uniref:1,4-beta-N-acetylmuramidase n=1 Tax=Gardnerella vaginalis (strain ATCC 14019 / 317) TaxID=525284 RepID=E3DAC3_GARV3|nr:hypothetical protein HMPREF0421_20935 [Gardnerella vaginalis ATCC 14019]RFT22568.1 1,4-beta-N-acetylmuramidase [Gardnerella vaginalis]SDR70376.1 hypothetical protein SAMN04488545_0293 [Gardnerella vaginalis]VEH17765.1 Uncharacterised protein [Gardnerella vaginalis]
MRSKYYDDGVTLMNGMPLADYVASKGLTKEQYINDIRYDRANEEDAYRRANETVQHGKLGHFAADGVSLPNYDGRKAWGENVAWGESPEEAMSDWTAGEESALHQSNGAATTDNAHLYQILNPENISFGYGEIAGTKYGRVSVLTLSTQVGDTDYPQGKLGVAPHLDFAWIIRNNDIAVGANAYTDKQLEYRWLSYNLNTQQWATIADWSTGNWASWVTKPGDYWLHCEARDPSTKKVVLEKTIAFHYTVPSQTVITGTYAGWQGSSVLLGASTNNPNGSTKIKIYDYNAKQWVEGFDGPWALWSPRPGIYWTHFEAYDENGNLSDVKTYAFGV